MEPLYEDNLYTVTPSRLRTPKQTFTMSKIEYVSLRAPYLIMSLPIALASFGAVFAFGRYLYTAEIAVLIGLAIALPIIGAQFGVMKLHSLALRDGDPVVYGRIDRLRKVRAAIDAAIDAREQAHLSRGGSDHG